MAKITLKLNGIEVCIEEDSRTSEDLSAIAYHYFYNILDNAVKVHFISEIKVAEIKSAENIKDEKLIIKNDKIQTNDMALYA